MAKETEGPQFGGNVETVLASPRIAPAPATLEEARNAPGRDDKIEELTRLIEDQGIKYVFFQQVSITGRVMGKGIPAALFMALKTNDFWLNRFGRGLSSPLPGGERSICAANRVRGAAPTIDRNPSPALRADLSPRER